MHDQQPIPHSHYWRPNNPTRHSVARPRNPETYGPVWLHSMPIVSMVRDTPSLHADAPGCLHSRFPDTAIKSRYDGQNRMALKKSLCMTNNQFRIPTTGGQTALLVIPWHDHGIQRRTVRSGSIPCPLFLWFATPPAFMRTRRGVCIPASRIPRSSRGMTDKTHGAKKIPLHDQRPIPHSTTGGQTALLVIPWHDHGIQRRTVRSGSIPCPLFLWFATPPAFMRTRRGVCIPASRIPRSSRGMTDKTHGAKKIPLHDQRPIPHSHYWRPNSPPRHSVARPRNPETYGPVWLHSMPIVSMVRDTPSLHADAPGCLHSRFPDTAIKSRYDGTGVPAFAVPPA